MMSMTQQNEAVAVASGTQGRALLLCGVSTTRPKSANATDLCRNGRNHTFPYSDRESDTRFPLLTCASELMGTSAFLNDPKLVISIGIP